MSSDPPDRTPPTRRRAHPKWEQLDEQERRLLCDVLDRIDRQQQRVLLKRDHQGELVAQARHLVRASDFL